MAKIIAYNNPIDGRPNQCFCQIRFETGERILISQTKYELKILKLFLGMIPTKVLLNYSLGESIDIIQNELESEAVYPFTMDYFKDKILPMASINEMLTFFDPITYRLKKEKK